MTDPEISTASTPLSLCNSERSLIFVPQKWFLGKVSINKKSAMILKAYS